MRTATLTSKLREQFSRQIRSGHWPAGQTIPTEMQLVEQYGASRTAVRGALKQLEGRGWLKSVQGMGRTVTSTVGQWQATVGLLALGTEFIGGQGSRFFAAIDQNVAGIGYSLVTYRYNQPYDGESPSQQSRRMHLDALDGAVVYAPQYQYPQIAFLARRMPVVSTPHDATAVGVPSFFVDYGFHAAIAVQELVKLGHRNIVLLTSAGPQRALVNSAVRRGYDLGRFNSGLALDPGSVVSYAYPPDEQTYARMLDQCLARSPAPTAVISYSSMPLVQMIQIGRQRGIDIARSMSLVCLADLTGDKDMPLPIAHFRNDIEAIVQDAVQCLNRMLHDERPEQLHHLYYGKLERGQTMRPAGNGGR